MIPSVRFLPSGGLIAVGMGEGGGWCGIRLYDNPVELANAPRALRGEVSVCCPIPISGGADALSYFFTTAPFLSRGDEPVFTQGENPTPSFREAFSLLTSPRVHFIRGEIGAFLIGVVTDGGSFRVAGITRKSRTLTLRLEDIWLSLPSSQRALLYTLFITRDVNRRDTPDMISENLVREVFPDQPGNTRVVLDLSPDGGFVVECRPVISR